MILQIISFFLLIRFKSIFSSEFPVLDENFEKVIWITFKSNLHLIYNKILDR